MSVDDRRHAQPPRSVCGGAICTCRGILEARRADREIFEGSGNGRRIGRWFPTTLLDVDRGGSGWTAGWRPDDRDQRHLSRHLRGDKENSQTTSWSCRVNGYRWIFHKEIIIRFLRLLTFVNFFFSKYKKKLSCRKCWKLNLFVLESRDTKIVYLCINLLNSLYIYFLWFNWNCVVKDLVWGLIGRRNIRIVTSIWYRWEK